MHWVLEAMVVSSSKDTYLAQKQQLGLPLGEVCGSLLSSAILTSELNGNMTEATIPIFFHL